MKDGMGNVLFVGDYITYVTRRSGGMNYHIARIHNVRDNKLEVVTYNPWHTYSWGGKPAYRTTLTSARTITLTNSVPEDIKNIINTVWGSK